MLLCVTHKPWIICKKYGVLKAHLSNLSIKFDIIAISEAGTRNVNLIENTFEGYQFYHVVPDSVTTKGGVHRPPHI